MQVKHSTHRQVGRTRHAGFEVGMRKTFPISPEAAWELLTSEDGLRIWLGDIDRLPEATGMPYTTYDGTRGKVQSLEPGGHVRLSWQPEGWPKPSTLQVRLIAAENGTTISFHQEKLPNADERENMRQRLEKVLAELDQLIAQKGL